MSNFRTHTPVLLKEAIDGLSVQVGKKYIDATVGGGGHGIEILREGGRLLGIDEDPEAIEAARENFKFQIACLRQEILEHISSISNFKLAEANWKIVQGNFRNIERIARENGFETVDGILFDLGVSSHQLDTSERGFSYRFAESPLDLRFDQKAGESASELINRLSEEELYEILAKFGEEKRARTIAHAFVRSRHLAPINKIGDLVATVDEIVPKPELNATLSRVFQALRIAVNDELENLKLGLSGAQKLMGPRGRLVVISFHSLEDRIAKQFMRQGSWKILTKKPIVVGKRELAANIRARSAKLRIAEKI